MFMLPKYVDFHCLNWGGEGFSLVNYEADWTVAGLQNTGRFSFANAVAVRPALKLKNAKREREDGPY